MLHAPSYNANIVATILHWSCDAHESKNIFLDDESCYQNLINLVQCLLEG